MEFGLPFSFPFKDPDWFKKIGIIALVSLIPIVGQMVAFGWGLEIARRVINHDPDPLPSLDFGDQLKKGFQAWVISFVYALPMIVLMLPLQLALPIGQMLEIDEGTLSIIMIAVSICCGGLSLIYGIFMAFMLSAAYGRFVTEGTIGSGLKFGEVLKLIKAAPVAYLIVLLGQIVAGFVGSLGSIACGIGVFLTMAYSFAIIGHFIGQAYNQATLALSHQP